METNVLDFAADGENVYVLKNDYRTIVKFHYESGNKDTFRVNMEIDQIESLPYHFQAMGITDGCPLLMTMLKGYVNFQIFGLNDFAYVFSKEALPSYGSAILRKSLSKLRIGTYTSGNKSKETLFAVQSTGNLNRISDNGKGTFETEQKNGVQDIITGDMYSAVK